MVRYIMRKCSFRSLLTTSVYRSYGWMDVVADAAEVSMNPAVWEIKKLPGYSYNGEVSVSHDYDGSLL